MKKMLCSTAIVIAAMLGVVSCENDLTPLGASFLGEDPAGVIQETEFDVKTYSAPINPVQTSNFNSFPFGVYDDPVYGTSTYEFVTQVNLAFVNPDFGDNPEVEQVFLEVPYFSTPTGINADNAEITDYRLDSVYGNSTIEIEVRRSNYFLNSFDNEDLTARAIYYSNFENEIELNEGELIYGSNSFVPSAVEEIVDESLTTEKRLSPRLRKSLEDLTRWEDIMLTTMTNSDGQVVKVARPELASASNFQNYFRGLYFKVVNPGSVGNLVHFNLNQAKIVVTISQDTDEEDTDNVDDDPSTLFIRRNSDVTINFNGNKIGFIRNDFHPTVITDIQASSDDPANGAENVYLKGGSGSLAVIELFGQATSSAVGEAPSLTAVIENEWLINDAYIDFYVNRSITSAGPKDPERILIYDYDTNRLLSDYVIGNAVGLNSNLNHLGRLERIDNDATLATDPPREKYRIRLTQHLNNIVQGNLENARLAIVVSQNVSLIGNSSVSNTVSPNPDLELIPISSAISHEGTVLHGNLSSDLDKRPKLKVFYSETRRAN
jgi:hypothetical protein